MDERSRRTCKGQILDVSPCLDESKIDWCEWFNGEVNLLF